MDNSDIFRPIGNVECHMAAPMEEVADNIRASLKRKLPEIEQLPEWKKPKGKEPFAIAGGGPSIQYTVETLRNFRTVLAAGSAHDWLIEHGVRPRYCLILDPDKISANYIRRPDPLCTYLVASCCHPAVFDVLAGHSVVRWHAAGHDLEWYEKELLAAGIEPSPDKSIIGGGPTCGLRAITVAMMLGYGNLHFFGLDSNLDPNTDAHHAYDFVDPAEELGEVIQFSLLPPPQGRVWSIAKYMLAQLWSFQDLINNYGGSFDITVHGDSALQEYWRTKKFLAAQIQKETKEPSNEL